MLLAASFIRRRAQALRQPSSSGANPYERHENVDDGISANQDADDGESAAQFRRPSGRRPAPLPLRTRLQRMGAWFEQFIVRHRTSSAIIFAYCSFFWRIYDETGKLDPAIARTPLSPGQMHLDSTEEVPLTRANVLSRVRLLETTGRRSGAGLRRESIGRMSVEEAERLSELQDPIGQLESLLQHVAATTNPVRRARLLTETYAALGHLHSASGHYYEMLHAMALALRTSSDAGDIEAVADLHVSFGHLELKHHRYYAAGTRFEDALQSGGGAHFENMTRMEALAGLGWAMLMQGNADAANVRFFGALGWPPPGAQLNHSIAAAAVSIADESGCRASLDGLDGVRALSLAGLSLANTPGAAWAVRAAGKFAANDCRSTPRLLECAVSLFHGVPRDLQQPHIWHALGLARHVVSDSSMSLDSQLAAARRYHQRVSNQERRDPSLLASGIRASTMCAAAADLPACSHRALHLGLLDFNAGNMSLGILHVEHLLARAGKMSTEAAEWLIRFARAHAWTPSGPDFASFLLGRAEPLLRDEGDARVARHLVDYGCFLLAHRDRPARIRRALTQLNRASDIIERTDIGWPPAEVAALYSSIGSAQHQTGEMEKAIRSFEKALEHNRRALVADDALSHKRLLMSYASLGAARIQMAGADRRRWRVALADFKDGRRAAREAGLRSDDSVVKSFEASFRNAMRLAHHRGVLDTCPGPLSAFLYGLSCPSAAES